MSKLEATIKRAILDYKLPRSQLAKESGVSEAMLSRVMNGKRKMSLGAAEGLAGALGLIITIKASKKTGTKTKKGK
jgi:transcriptional regulator with XRE-family HTH domain